MCVSVCNPISQEKLLLQPMFEVPDSDIIAVHIDKESVLGLGSAHYSRSSDDTTAVSVVSSGGQLVSQDRESILERDSLAV